jgi:hypothetical protein
VEAKPRRVEYYRRPDDSCPFEEWMLSLTKDVRATVVKRLDRIE